MVNGPGDHEKSRPGPGTRPRALTSVFREQLHGRAGKTRISASMCVRARVSAGVSVCVHLCARACVLKNGNNIWTGRPPPTGRRGDGYRGVGRHAFY